MVSLPGMTNLAVLLLCPCFPGPYRPPENTCSVNHLCLSPIPGSVSRGSIRDKHTPPLHMAECLSALKRPQRQAPCLPTRCPQTHVCYRDGSYRPDQMGCGSSPGTGTQGSASPEPPSPCLYERRPKRDVSWGTAPRVANNS